MILDLPGTRSPWRHHETSSAGGATPEQNALLPAGENQLAQRPSALDQLVCVAQVLG